MRYRKYTCVIKKVSEHGEEVTPVALGLLGTTCHQVIRTGYLGYRVSDYCSKFINENVLIVGSTWVVGVKI